SPAPLLPLRGEGKNCARTGQKSPPRPSRGEGRSEGCAALATHTFMTEINSRTLKMLEKSPDPQTFDAPDWAPDRWANIARDYTPDDVARLSGSLPIRHTLAENGARRLWELLHSEDFVPTLGTFTGNQAVQQVKAGLKAIYLSGWQVAADANSSGNMYPDQSLYPVDSVPEIVRRINKALQRADQIQTMERLD